MQRIGDASLRVKTRVTRVCFVDGVRANEDAALPVGDHGVLLGDSIFETLRAYGGKPFMLEEHLDRLYASAIWARMTIGAERAEVSKELAAGASEIDGDAALRIFVTRGKRPLGEPLVNQKTRRIVIAEELVRDDALYERGARACMLVQKDFGTAEGAHAKYARYLPRLLARDEARLRGVDEALLADDAGNIVEAATGSELALRDDVVITSSVLEGLTAKKSFWSKRASCSSSSRFVRSRAKTFSARPKCSSRRACAKSFRSFRSTDARSAMGASAKKRARCTPRSNVARLLDRDRVDLDARALRQPRDLHRRTRGKRPRKSFRVDLVHFRKICHLDQIDRRANDVLEAETGGAKNRAEVVERAFRFFCDVGFHHFAGARIERDLPAQKHHRAARANGLRIRSNCFRSIV